MDVEIAEERIVLLADRFNLDHAEGRAWTRRSDAFGTVARIGGLLNRGGSDDYACVYRERRLQPFVLEERVSVDVVDLVYRPVYAFRYRHAGREAIIEFDGLTGDVKPDGSSFEQYLGQTIDPRFLLDVGIEAVNLFVPGTQLARIVVQHGVQQVTDQRKRTRLPPSSPRST